MNIINDMRKKFNDNEVDPDKRGADLNKVIEMCDSTRQRTYNWNETVFDQEKAKQKEQEEKTLETTNASAIRAEEAGDNRGQMRSDEVNDPLRSDDFLDR